MSDALQSTPIYLSLEFTPNPNTLKYSVNRQILPQGAAHFADAQAAASGSPLANALFSVPGIVSVMLGRDFVAITKSEEGDWDVVHKNCGEKIKAHLSQGLPILNPGYQANANRSGGGAAEDIIRKVLDEEIRPTVALDGGDITFEKYENGVVYLYMQGACAGCPSSTATLKEGIENRLKELIPDLKEVVSI